jgi:hypothetical protein
LPGEGNRRVMSNKEERGKMPGQWRGKWEEGKKIIEIR